MSSTKNNLFGMALIAIMLMFVGSLTVVQAAETHPTLAGTTIVNGTWDGSTAANEAGELTCELSGVITGMLADSLDTVSVESCYSMDSIPRPADVGAATSYDTVFLLYQFQNQGNLATDSFSVLANVVDTGATGGFIPTDFDIVAKADSSVISTSPSGDSAEYYIRLASAGVCSFLVRIVIPSPDSAADQDSIHVAVTVKDADGDGSDDDWPGLSGSDIKRVVIDTGGVYYDTHTDTLWDYGDTQTDTVRIVVGGPRIRLKKIAALESGTSLPGDSIVYTIMYDNDGSAATEDTAFIVDYLPYGIALLETVQTNPGDNAVGIKTYVYHNIAGWLDHIPGANGTVNAVRDSMLRITALKFAIEPGIAADAGDVDQDVADDSTGTDAGVITYRVRIR